MSASMIEIVKAALKPLVNDGMDEKMLDAWLTDLARAAIEAMRSDLGKSAYEISGFSSPGEEAEAAMLDWIDTALGRG